MNILLTSQHRLNDSEDPSAWRECVKPRATDEVVEIVHCGEGKGMADQLVTPSAMDAIVTALH